MKLAIGAVLLVGATAFPFANQRPRPDGVENEAAVPQFRGADVGAQGVPIGPAGPGQNGRVGGGSALAHSRYGVVTDECRAAVNSTCAVCAEGVAEECRSCVETNSEALVGAGCSHIACEQAMQQLCPACASEFPQTMDPNCRYCGNDNTTDVCKACRADFQLRRQATMQCHDCVEANTEALAAEGCTQLSCKAAVKELCPICSSVGEADCRYCEPSNTTDACAACEESRAECAECMHANNASLPEGCAVRRQPSPKQPNTHRSFGNGAEAAHMGVRFGAPKGARTGGAPGGAPGGAQGAISEDCRVAFASICATCVSSGAPNATASGACADVCTNRRSEECTTCRQQAAEECRVCISTNADSLIAEGCSHIVCTKVTEEMCPACVPDDPTDVDEDCRFCGPENLSEACQPCHEQAEERLSKADECHTCKEQNLDVLAEGGCTHYVCQRAVEVVCDICASARNDPECRHCRPGNTTEACVHCQEEHAGCRKCMESNQSVLPEECAVTNTAPVKAPQPAVGGLLLRGAKPQGGANRGAKPQGGAAAPESPVEGAA